MPPFKAPGRLFGSCKRRAWRAERPEGDSVKVVWAGGEGHKKYFSSNFSLQF